MRSIIVPLKLRKGSHDGEHRLAHRAFGVQPFGEAAESDPSGPQLVDHGENVLGVTSEAVELPDGEHVAFAEMVEAGIEMGSARCRAAHAIVGVDARRPGFLKRVELKLGILIGSAHPCVLGGLACRMSARSARGAKNDLSELVRSLDQTRGRNFKAFRTRRRLVATGVAEHSFNSCRCVDHQ